MTKLSLWPRVTSINPALAAFVVDINPDTTPVTKSILASNVLASLLANVSVNGIDVTPGSDIDADLITVGVTGTPKLWWDESEDSLALTHRLYIERADALTNTIAPVARLTHTTSGTAAAAFGASLEYELENAAGNKKVCGALAYTWKTATGGNETSEFAITIVKDGGAQFLFRSKGIYDLFIGRDAGNASVAGTGENNGIGYAALKAVTGGENTALGHNCLTLNAAGASNTAVGNRAMVKNVTGNYNTAVGKAALSECTAGYNSALGYNALRNNAGGYSNSAVGVDALNANLTGTQNVGVGRCSLMSNTTGVDNTACGTDAGYCNAYPEYANITGSYNTWLGSGSGPHTVAVLTNAMALGYFARNTASNQVVLGDTNITTGGVGTPIPEYMWSLNGAAARTMGMNRASAVNDVGNALTIIAGGATNNMVATVTIANGGTGYSVNDVLTLRQPPGGVSATVTVATVSGGVVTGVTVTTKGSKYAVATYATTVAPAGGTGCTIAVATLENATNKAGGNLILSSGISTGTGASSIEFRPVAAGASGATDNSPATKLTLAAATLTFADAVDIVTNATTGTKIGTAASQKLGFWGHAPAIQPAKASYANWAALANVVQALVDIGIFDAA